MADDLAEELGRNIPLSEMLQSLRQELALAKLAGKGAGIRFDIDEVEVELQVSVSKDRGANGKVSFWVLEGGAEAKAANASVHTFKLKLRVLDEDGVPLRVDDPDSITEPPGR